VRQTVLWPRCAHCEHRVNPRAETCEEHHLMCTPDGCQVDPRGWPKVPVAAFEAPVARTDAPRRASQTTFLVDLASYQAGINLAAVRDAGYTRVNIKLTQGTWYVHSNAAGFARQARDLGLGICTFHWLDNSASGIAQADFMWRQMLAIGGPAGVAHQCDCEDSARPATLDVWRDYMRRVTGLLGRPVVNYTGDWWWQPRGWVGQPESPYLWAGPNAGYLGTYPGDTSSHWKAGYGGWSDYAMLQYAVQPVAGAGGGNLSKTAIRDPAVWAALTGAAQPPVRSDPMLILTHIDGKPYVCDGMVCRPIDDDNAGHLRTLAAEGAVQLAYGGKFRDGWVPAFGAVAEDVGLVLTDAQLERLAAALVARPDNPLGEQDQSAIRAALHAELADLTLRADRA
jgi:hypothetical protein